MFLSLIQNKKKSLKELARTNELEISSFAVGSYETDKAFSIGTGISTLDLYETRTVSLYPVYANNQIIVSFKEGNAEKDDRGF